MRYVKHMIACFLGLLLMGLCSYSVEAAQLADYGEVIITKGNQSVIQTTWNLLNPQEKGLTWEFQSNRPEVATVDQQGIISAKKKGKAKIARILKNIGMVEAVEGAQGGYYLLKDPREITLLDVVKATESTIKINRCLEKDEFCSNNGIASCKVHRTYVGLQEELEQRLSMITIAYLVGKEESQKEPSYFGEFAIQAETGTYQCLYVGDKLFREKFPKDGAYSDLIDIYTREFIHEEDQNKMREFLMSQEDILKRRLKKWDAGIRYRRRHSDNREKYIWMTMETHYDHERNLIIISVHNSRLIDRKMTEKEAKLNAREHDAETQMLNEYSYNICKYHHERYDGSGYPEQLKGDEIPFLFLKKKSGYKTKKR